MKVEAQGGVYEISNSIDDRIYIGSTCNFERRYKEHFRNLQNNTHHNNHLQRFVNKYGINKLQFKILSRELNNRINIEQEYLNSYSNFFNLSKIAGKVEMTAEIRKKIGEKTSKSIRTSEQKQHLSIINTGKIVSFETKQKLSLLAKKARITSINYSGKYTGERNGQSKLSDKDVLDIRKALNSGIKGKILAVKYKVTASCISLIKRNITYKHLL